MKYIHKYIHKCMQKRIYKQVGLLHKFLTPLQYSEREPGVSLPHFDLEFVADCDANNFGLEAVILQWQDDQEKVLGTHEQPCSATKNMLAMVYAIKHFHHHMIRRQFPVSTDHNTLMQL